MKQNQISFQCCDQKEMPKQSNALPVADEITIPPQKKREAG